MRSLVEPRNAGDPLGPRCHPPARTVSFWQRCKRAFILDGPTLSLRACPRCVPVPVVCLSPLCACPRCVDGPTLLAFRSPPFSCGATHLSVTVLPTGSDCFVLATRFRWRCQPLRISLEPVISAEAGIQGACSACPRCVDGPVVWMAPLRSVSSLSRVPPTF